MIRICHPLQDVDLDGALRATQTLLAAPALAADAVSHAIASFVFSSIPQVMSDAPGRARFGAAFGKTDRSASVEAADGQIDHGQIISPGWSKIGEEVSTKAFSTKELRGYERGYENEKLSLARVPP